MEVNGNSDHVYFNQIAEKYSLKGDFTICDSGYAESTLCLDFNLKGFKLEDLCFDFHDILIEEFQFVNSIASRLNISFNDVKGLLTHMLVDLVGAAIDSNPKNGQYEYMDDLEYAYVTAKENLNCYVTIGANLKKLGLWKKIKLIKN